MSDILQHVGTTTSLFSRRRISAITSDHFRTGVLRIRRKGFLVWEGLRMGSGFHVELIYSKHVRVTGEVIGLNDEFDLTSPLAKFLELNRSIVEDKLPVIEETISSYRQHHRRESQWKNRVLSYRFLAHVFAQPRDPTGLPQSSIEGERDGRVRQLMLDSGEVFESAYQRYAAVSRSEATAWWYIFWVSLLCTLGR